MEQLSSVTSLIKEAGVLDFVKKSINKTKGLGLVVGGPAALFFAPNPARGKFGLEGLIRRYTPEQKAMYQQNAQKIQDRLERLARLKGIRTDTDPTLSYNDALNKVLGTVSTGYSPQGGVIQGSSRMLSNPLVYAHELGHGLDKGTGWSKNFTELTPAQQFSLGSRYAGQVLPAISGYVPQRHANKMRLLNAIPQANILKEEATADYIANNLLNRLESKIGPIGISKKPYWARQIIGGYAAPFIGADMAATNMRDRMARMMARLRQARSAG